MISTVCSPQAALLPSCRIFPDWMILNLSVSLWLSKAGRTRDDPDQTYAIRRRVYAPYRGDHCRGPVSYTHLDGLDGLGGIGTPGHLGYVHIAVLHGALGEALLLDLYLIHILPSAQRVS